MSNLLILTTDNAASERSTRSTRSSRRGSRATSPEGPSERSPPTQRARVDESSSPLPLAPTSPLTEQQDPDRSLGLFSSPTTRTGGFETSEIDLSSPLNYGTPSSRLAGTPRGSVYPTY